MTKKEFDNTLKQMALTRQEFCRLTGLAYSTVANWNDERLPIPSGVGSWIENYEKAKSSESMRDQVFMLTLILSVNSL